MYDMMTGSVSSIYLLKVNTKVMTMILSLNNNNIIIFLSMFRPI